MILTELKLKQLILEEVSEKIVIEEIRSVITEMQLDLSGEQHVLLEQSVLDALKSASKKAGKPLAVMALLAFGSQVASDLYDLENVGVSPTSAEQISNAVKASQKISDARANFIQKAIERSGREGEIPADLAKGVSPDDAKDIAMDNLENNFAMKGDIESTGQAQQTADGVQ